MPGGKICYRCHSSHVVKCGLSSKGCQRYKCQNCGRSFTCQTEYVGYRNSTRSKIASTKNSHVKRSASESTVNSTVIRPHVPISRYRISTKSKTAALVLCLLTLIGLSGFHRIYVGKIKSGILYLFTLGLFGIGAIVDFVQIASDKFEDSDGKILTWFTMPPQSPNNAQPYAPTPYEAAVNNGSTQPPTAATSVQSAAQPIQKEIKTFSLDEAIAVYFFTEHVSCKSIYQYKRYFSDAFSCILHNIPKYRIVLSDEKVLRQKEILNPISDMQNITKATSINKLKNFVSIDVETTGLKPGGNDIIEICAIKFINFRPVVKFHTYLKPRNPIPSDASAINHITDAMVENAPVFSQIKPNLQSFIDGFPLVAHNAAFDMAFLHSSGLSLEKHVNSVYDTLKLARLKIRDYDGEKLENYKLSEVCKELNIECSDFHTADADALACGILFSDIVKRVNGVTSTDDLLKSGK